MAATLEDRLIQYGVPSDLARKAEGLGLTVTKIRALSQNDLNSIYGLSGEQAQEITRCVRRQRIENDTLDLLLIRSNFRCNICKGNSSSSFVVHHIDPYENNQNNEYDNLIVLCPNDHDRAHHSGLSTRINSRQLRLAKKNWEYQVEVENAQKAARAVDIDTQAVDYINVKRIEEFCVNVFGQIPTTTRSDHLIKYKILNEDRYFDLPYVRKNLSGGSYLFDYMSVNEGAHYEQLIRKLNEEIEFADLSEAVHKGYAATKSLEGRYSYFIGGVNCKQPQLPITAIAKPIVMNYQKGNIRVEWDLDPNYLFSMSAIARMGRKNRYIVYGLVRTVNLTDDGKACLVNASPLFIAMPSSFIDRTPQIARETQFEREKEFMDNFVESDDFD